MNKSVVVIGGGIVGLCTAYYLWQEGHQVAVIDASDFSKGASYVNAGYITPSHIIPLAAPGMITKGLKWMFNSRSPFYVKPSLDPDFLKWGLAFKQSAKNSKVEKAIPVIKDINLLSRELYEEMQKSGSFDFHYQRNGLLMLCRTTKGLEGERTVAKKARAAGLEVVEVALETVKKYEPGIDLDIEGGFYYDCDAHMTPQNFMGELLMFLKSKGVQIFAGEEVVSLGVLGNQISEVVTNKQTFKADEVVLAAGTWSAKIAKQLGISLLLQAGKGYRIDIHRPTSIQTPAILVESKVAVTPMQGFTRFAGTMEIGGINHKIRWQRVQAIATAAQRYYTGLEFREQDLKQAACGLRPCSPDGLPYIGRSEKYRNLCFATGHAMMGWSLGPATGKLISEVISEKNPTMNLDAFHPDRRF